MNIFEEKIKFEKLLLAYKVPVLTVAYHGSLLGHVTPKSDLDVVLIIEDITPDLFRKINSITKKINNFLGTNFKISVKTFDSLVNSLEKNLGLFYRHEKIKVGRYSERVETVR